MGILSRFVAAAFFPARPPIDVHYEAIIIGGGANGTGLARDLALRGLKVALYEKGDFGGGATGASSGMIHGGPRYLLDDTATTAHACEDSGYIQKIAPHLCFRIPFLFPIPKANPFGPFGTLLHDVFFDVYDRYTPLKNGIPHARVTVEDMRHIEPGLTGDFQGGVTLDEWGIDVARLCLLNALDAEANGATIATYTEVVDVLQAPDGSVKGVAIRSAKGGPIAHKSAPVVINCAGPWADELVRRPDGRPLANASSQASPTRRLRPGKGVHLVYEKRLSNFAIVTQAIDGRQVFVMPYMNETWVGTTDDDYYGDLNDLWATGDEVAYLREAGEAILPALREQRLIGTRVGVRNTVHGWGVTEDALSRRYEVADHGSEGVSGFYSLLGGKLASYRIQASEAADKVCRQLACTTACSTHERPLPGGAAAKSPEALAAHYPVSAQAARRLLSRHGSMAEDVLDFAAGLPEGLRVLDAAEPLLRGEVEWCLAREHVVRLSDLMARCRLAMGSDMGLHALVPAAQMMAEARGLTPAQGRAEAAELMMKRWRSVRPVMEGPQLALVELWLQQFAKVAPGVDVFDG